MVENGVTDTGYSDEFIENLVKYVTENEDLLQVLEKLLEKHGFKKEGTKFNDSAIKDLSKLLMEEKDLLGTAIKIVREHFEQDKGGLAEFIKHGREIKGMEGKLEALGNQLLVQGVISGAAFTTLTGALVGTLAIGGVAGALVTGGAALVGFFALIAIAAIAHAMYKHKSEIKESVDKVINKVEKGTVDLGKAVKSFMKNVIDKLPTIHNRDKNFYKLYQELSQLALQTDTEGNEIKSIQNKAKVIELLQSEEQRSAIQELVKERAIENFSEDEMKRLIDKGVSTHESDMEALKELVNAFLPKIMAVGGDEINEVKQKVDEKAQEMKPPSSEMVNPAHPIQHSSPIENLGKN